MDEYTEAYRQVDKVIASATARGYSLSHPSSANRKHFAPYCHELAFQAQYFALRICRWRALHGLASRSPPPLFRRNESRSIPSTPAVATTLEFLGHIVVDSQRLESRLRTRGRPGLHALFGQELLKSAVLLRRRMRAWEEKAGLRDVRLWSAPPYSRDHGYRFTEHGRMRQQQQHRGPKRDHHGGGSGSHKHRNRAVASGRTGIFSELLTFREEVKAEYVRLKEDISQKQIRERDLIGQDEHLRSRNAVLVAGMAWAVERWWKHKADQKKNVRATRKAVKIFESEHDYSRERRYPGNSKSSGSKSEDRSKSNPAGNRRSDNPNDSSLGREKNKDKVEGTVKTTVPYIASESKKQAQGELEQKLEAHRPDRQNGRQSRDSKAGKLAPRGVALRGDSSPEHVESPSSQCFVRSPSWTRRRGGYLEEEQRRKAGQQGSRRPSAQEEGPDGDLEMRMEGWRERARKIHTGPPLRRSSIKVKNVHTI